MFFNTNKQGLTLVETLVGAAVFSVIAISVYGAYAKILEATNTLKIKGMATDLAVERFEVIKNFPYSSIGVQGGIPNGIIPHTEIINRGGVDFTVNTSVRNIDDPADGEFGSTTNDLSPADNKLVEVEINCEKCKNFLPIIYTARMAPKNLENSTNNGALFIRVFDANGQPVPQASVHVVNNVATSTITIDDETNNSGVLQIVDVPPGAAAYQITVSKDDYSTDRTYTTDTSNPNPTKPHSTVAAQNATNISFSIDKLSTVKFKTVDGVCNVVPNIGFNIEGSKTLGTNPTVLKTSRNLSTNSSGFITVDDVEWDNYAIKLSGSTYDLIGLNPILPLNISPGTSQNVSMILGSHNPNRLLVTVRDGATGLPITDAKVTIENGGTTHVKNTEKGFLSQTEWNGGGGQNLYTDQTKYFDSDGNLDNSVSGQLSLQKVLNNYVGNGELVSSTFDTGANDSNYGEILWQPSSNDPATGTSSVKFQIAVSSDPATTTWNFIGPDGTSGTYFNSANYQLPSAIDNERYFRYKTILSTASSTISSILSDVTVTFTSDCLPAGQVSYGGLSSGVWNITVEKSGYQTYTNSVNLDSNWKAFEVNMLSE